MNRIIIEVTPDQHTTVVVEGEPEQTITGHCPIEVVGFGRVGDIELDEGPVKAYRPGTDLEVFQEIFSRAGVDHRSWKVRGTLDPKVAIEEAVLDGPFTGYTLVIGSEDDGPNADFTFDLDGNLKYATANYCRGGKLESAYSATDIRVQ